MEALILSGGFGTRLRPLTFSCPKPLIPFCNRPIMEHQISALAKAGVKKIVLAISDDPQWLHLIKLFIKKVQFEYKVSIVLSIETEPLGTAGPLALAKKEINADNFFVLNSDVICCYPLGELARFHLFHRGEGTILTTKVDDPSRYGVIISDGHGVIEKFIEKPKEFVGNEINAGIYCFQRSILDRIQVRKISIENDIFPAMAAEKELFCLSIPSKEKFWMDIGQPKDYLAGTLNYIDILKTGPIIGRNCRISETAVIGPHVVVADNCSIEKAVEIDRSVVFSGTIIKQNSKVFDCILGWDCIVNEQCSLGEMTVLEKNVVVQDGTVLKGNLVCSHKTVGRAIDLYSIVL